MIRDALRLSVGTLTVLPTRPPRTVDREVGGVAMVLAPVVGGVLAVAAGLLLWLLGWGPSGRPPAPQVAWAAAHGRHLVPPLLASALAVALLVGLTRAMHLDGLADTADGLGSGRPGPEALEVMRRGDVGPFGVVSLVLAVMLQVLALGALAARGLAVPGVCLALVLSRFALPLACRSAVPAARPEGLGAVVAGTVGARRLAASGLLGLTTTGALGWVCLGPAVLDPSAWVRVLTAAVLALGAAALLLRRAVRRLGGVTGDVLGAVVEVTFTTTLVVLVLAT